METLLGICGRSFSMVAADTMQVRGILVMRDDDNKIHKISDNVVFAVMGAPGDTTKFTHFISRNVALYKFQNSYEMSPRMIAHYTRCKLGEFIRNKAPFKVNMVIAGYDKKKKAGNLYFIDVMANALSIKYSGQGYGGRFAQSIFDAHYKEDITKDEAYNILKLCVAAIHKRLLLNIKSFNVVVVDENGITKLPDIKECEQEDLKKVNKCDE